MFHPRPRAAVAMVPLLFAVGCGDPVATAQPPAADEAPSNLAPTGPEVVKLDGVAEEWQGFGPLWAEAGAPGSGPFHGGLDIQQVYVTNDETHLYVCLRTETSVQARYDATPVSGELCDLYFDTDNNPRTGCRDVEGFDYGKINGYEFKAWIPLGVYSNHDGQGNDGKGPFVSYDLLVPAELDGNFGRSAAIEPQLSQQPDALIAHGADGVELAIPLEVFGVEAGASLRLLLKESADPFAKERYSEGTYVVR